MEDNAPCWSIYPMFPTCILCTWPHSLHPPIDTLLGPPQFIFSWSLLLIPWSQSPPDEELQCIPLLQYDQNIQIVAFQALCWRRVFVWWNKPWLVFQALCWRRELHDPKQHEKKRHVMLFIFMQSNGSSEKLWSLGDMFIQTKQLSECKIYLLFTSERNTLWVSLSQVTLQFIVTFYDIQC